MNQEKKLVVFHFSSGGPHGKCQETVEMEADATDEDIDAAFNNWLYERSGAAWWDANDPDRSNQ